MWEVTRLLNTTPPQIVKGNMSLWALGLEAISGVNA